MKKFYNERSRAYIEVHDLNHFINYFFLVRFKSADISLYLSHDKIFENRQCEQKPVDTETRRLRSSYFVNREKLIRLLDTISSLLIDYYVQHEAADVGHRTNK